MCLLGIVPKKSDRQEITTAWLRDVYERNSDGFGFAWSTPSGGVHVFKSVGKFREFKKAWREMERHSGEFAFHLRMKTHGEISKAMAHPYPVGETGLHLMHNGVLACGNAGDRTKSDTWHYINDVVLPLYNRIGDGIFAPELLKMMGEAIGNNRFVIVDRTGGLHVVNRQQGVEWNGMWLSNTYAWSASKFGFYRGASGGNAYGGTSLADDDGFDWKDWRTWSRQGNNPGPRNHPRRANKPVLGSSARSRQMTVIGNLLGKDGKPVTVNTDDKEPAPAGGIGNPSYDFIQLLYTLGYTDAANELSQNDVDDYIKAFGGDALEEFSVEVCEFTLDDDEIIAEIQMLEAEETGEDDEQDEEDAARFAQRAGAQVLPFGPDDDGDDEQVRYEDLTDADGVVWGRRPIRIESDARL